MSATTTDLDLFGAGPVGLPRWLREPFFHFLLLGGALFLSSHWIQEHTRYNRIVITKGTVAGLAQNYRLQYGRYPSPVQLESLIDASIREEVAFREAQQLHLGQDDEIVRRRLVQKYEFLQQDLAIAADPSESQLRTYFDAHTDRYRTPATARFGQVFFSADRRGATDARAAAQKAADTLNTSGANRAPGVGDNFPGPEEFPDLSIEEAERVFGQSELTARLFQLQPGTWSQPLRSAYGWHVIRVESYVPARTADFAAVAGEVRRDYLEEARQARNEAAYAALLKKFEIVRE